MRCIIVMPATLLCLLWHTVAAQEINPKKIDINLVNVTLEAALNQLSTLSGLKFNYKTADIAGINGIHYQAKQAPVKKVLADLLSYGALVFEEAGDHIIIKKNNRSSKNEIRVYGFVSAKESGEALAGATVSITGNNADGYTTATNSYGFYSLTVPKAQYRLICSYAGFGDFEQTLEVNNTIHNNIEMTLKKENELKTVEVVASGNKNLVKRPFTGYHRLNITEIKKIAMAGGEPDVLKSLQFLPGIQAANEGTTNLSVRGGSYDQNLILLDEAPVYNPTHTLGIFSVFNTDALKDVSIYKGVFPAQYGGRLSSVVDVRMKEGNSKQPEAFGGIGLLASRFSYEGPIQKDKSSFMISGRYSNLGALLNLSRKIGLLKFEPTNSNVSFYDLNLKINPILGNRDRLFLSAYFGHDMFYLNVIDHGNKMIWGNATVSGRWNHVFNASVFANTSLLFSNYQYASEQLDDGRNFRWKANLKEITLKTDVDWTIGRGNIVKSGLGITWQNVSPGSVAPLSQSSVVKPVVLNNRPSVQAFAYFNNEHRLGKKISLNYGLRATFFGALGDAWVYKYAADGVTAVDSTYYPKGKIVQSYMTIEPRANLRLLVSANTSLKLSYGRNYQFQHLLTSSSVGLPTDIWLPSDYYFKPQYSDQYAAGVFTAVADNRFETSLELYYRKSKNVIDFRDNADVFLASKIETQILTGEAKGYGAEWMLKKNKGSSTGWISYTYSKALRRIEGINNNDWYPPVYDHRHNFSIVYNLHLSRRLMIGANWVFRTGGFTTLPEGTFIYAGSRFLYYSQRNGYQLPAYHRMDISITLKQKDKQHKKWKGEWVLSVYDVYDRKNVFSLFVSQDPIFYSTTKAQMVYLTGILPSLTYNFKF